MRAVIVGICILMIPVSIAAGHGYQCVQNFCVVDESVTFCEASQAYRFQLTFSTVPRLDIDCSELDDRRLECPSHAFVYHISSGDLFIRPIPNPQNVCEIRRSGVSIGEAPYQLKDKTVVFYVPKNLVNAGEESIRYELFIMTSRMAAFYPITNHSRPGACKERVPMQNAPEAGATWGKIKQLFR